MEILAAHQSDTPKTEKKVTTTYISLTEF